MNCRRCSSYGINHLKFTIAFESISTVAFKAFAGEASLCVFAFSVVITSVNAKGTFIYICKTHKCQKVLWCYHLNIYTIHILTFNNTNDDRKTCKLKSKQLNFRPLMTEIIWVVIALLYLCNQNHFQWSRHHKHMQSCQGSYCR